MNPHAWRKFKQAEGNMIRSLYGSSTRRKRLLRVHYWAKVMNKWLERMGI